MTTKEKIEVMQHYVDGGKIEINGISGRWKEWTDHDEPEWDWLKCKYRIKQEPEYVPYDAVNVDWLGQKIRRKDNPAANYLIVRVNTMQRTISIVTDVGCKKVLLSELFKLFTHLDGTPFGRLK